MVIPVPLGGLPIEVGPGHPYLSIGVRQRSFDWSIILASLSHPRPEVRANLLKCKPSRFLSVLHTSHLLNQLSVKAEALTVAAPCPGQAVHASLGGLFPAWTSSTLAHLCYSWKTVNSSVPAPLPPPLSSRPAFACAVLITTRHITALLVSAPAEEFLGPRTCWGPPRAVPGPEEALRTHLWQA